MLGGAFDYDDEPPPPRDPFLFGATDTALIPIDNGSQAACPSTLPIPFDFGADACMFVTIGNTDPRLSFPPSPNEFLFFNDPRNGEMRNVGRRCDTVATVAAPLIEASRSSPLATGATRVLIDVGSQATCPCQLASFNITQKTPPTGEFGLPFRAPRRRKRQARRRTRRRTQHRDRRRRRSDQDLQGGLSADLQFRHPLGRCHESLRRRHGPPSQRAPREGRDQHHSVKTPRSLLPRRLHSDVPGWRRRSAHRHLTTTTDSRARGDRRTDGRRTGDADPRRPSGDERFLRRTDAAAP